MPAGASCSTKVPLAETVAVIEVPSTRTVMRVLLDADEAFRVAAAAREAARALMAGISSSSVFSVIAAMGSTATVVAERPPTSSAEARIAKGCSTRRTPRRWPR